ncbi:MAG TPA: NAD(P)H-hydrate dehydratase [Polyangia bacterium]|nr:NAD(P)H-hydrate dehydratase [Polyangia bacterium]
MSAAQRPSAVHPLVLSAEQMRAADRAASERLGLPSLLLMENAGRGVAEIVARALAAGAAREPVVVVSGGGANGGDGFVVARHLARRGVRARVLLAAPRARVSGDAAVMLAAVERIGGVPVDEGEAWTDEARWRAQLAGAGVVVDAIFGIGLRDDVTGVPAAALAAMNASDAYKVAVDIPSGLDADTGRVHGLAFRADVTATMGARKLGLVLDAAAPVGAIEVVELGAPLDAPSGPLTRWIEGGPVFGELPRRGATAHKGAAGHLLVVAGSEGKTGAALLAGRAALRAGTGLVTLASTARGQAALDAKVVEIMTARYTDGDDADPRESATVLAKLAGRMDAVALGPGIPTGPHMRAVVRDLASRLALPMVLDADALNLLGTEIVRVLNITPAPRVLTPHPGEMARLTGRRVEEIEADRLGAARDLAGRSKAVVVLKGARTLVAAPDGAVYVNPTATGALATAGSGDVLTGLIGALLAQGMEPLAAARAGVFIHGAAGEALGARLGSGVMAGDLPDAIAAVIQTGLQTRP